MTPIPFENLIQMYLTLVQDAIQRLQSRYGVATPDAVWSGRIPVAGRVSGMRYRYHGIGCTAVVDGHTVSWDWQGGRTDILDPWHIWQLTHKRPETYGSWADLRVLRQHMQDLAAHGHLEHALAGHSYQLPSRRLPTLAAPVH
ncbi:DUF6896 domain-containing protein [Deinococcus malanensis]|nr:hypothetical protein [Deinococcus malanensis]